MLNYIILGIIQGLTEFFPVSSSAHLVIAQKILNIQNGQLANAIVLHLGTAAALLIFFFRDIIAAARNIKLILFILVVTVITGTIGILGKDFFTGLFSETGPAAIALIITGVILILTSRFMAGKRDQPGFKDACILGAAQGAAIIPGISRSGITISTLLFRKMDRASAFRLSFLASIPAVFGACLLDIKDVDFALKENFSGLGMGFICSLASGLISLVLLNSILRRAKFHLFGYYCIIIAVLTLIFIK